MAISMDTAQHFNQVALSFGGIVFKSIRININLILTLTLNDCASYYVDPIDILNSGDGHLGLWHEFGHIVDFLAFFYIG